MIKYSLKCGEGCEFDAWFRSSADFDAQAEADLLECPACGSKDVAKAIMAPAVSTRSRSPHASGRDIGEVRAAIAESAARARQYVEKNFDYVGDQFPEEARAIHYGEREARGIYGEASGSEAKALVDEGVSIAPLPATAPRPAKKKLN